MFEIVVLIATPDLTRNEFDSLLPLVSQEKQECIQRFRFFRDSQNCLLGDILARIEICRVTGLSNESLQFSHNSYGKPFLSNNSHVHHNISHSGYYIACTVSNTPIGIDIELIKPIDQDILVEQVFAPDEIAYITNDQSTHRFFDIWTKKESRIKYEGKGLSMPLPYFSVLNPKEPNPPYYHEVFRNHEAICHVCSLHKSKPNVTMMDVTTLLRHSKQLLQST
jgi:4'-phosphopantetheinyl transferase